jgi:hypothetical protein
MRDEGKRGNRREMARNALQMECIHISDFHEAGGHAS